MSILSVQAVARRLGERLLFSDVSFRVARGDRVGLVGPNGTGKTTLLRIAAGLEEPDAGGVALARDTRCGYLAQEALADASGTVLEHARGAAAHLREIAAELATLEPEIARGDPDALSRYADAQHRFEHAGGYEFDSTVRRVLGGLGLDGLRERPVRELSGGERTRLGLARLLLDDPDLLLLDEPTNHLDVGALEWLERFLIERALTIVVSAHDRWFLDRVTSRTLSLEHLTLVEYRGGYSRYARQRAQREATLTKAAERQAEEIARTEDFIQRYGAGQRAKEARGRAKKLARIERISRPERGARHGWRLEAAHLASDTVLEITPLVAGHGKREIVRSGALRVAREARVAVVGPNGAGKTTLVRTLVGDLTPLDGYVTAAPTARVAFLAQAQPELQGDETVLDSLRSAGSGLDEGGARGLLARFLFRGEDVFRSVGVLSGGERSRLALARLAAREANLLVLDEPTNHLDLAAREALERVLADYQGTLIFVSHDRYFIDKLATEIWLIERGALRRFEGNWSALQRARAAGVGIAPGDVASVGRPVLRSARLRASERSSVAANSRRQAPPPAISPGAGVGRELRALEERIARLEEQLRTLQSRLEEIARGGNYLETRRAGEEYAALEDSLRELYDEWAAAGSE